MNFYLRIVPYLWLAIALVLLGAVLSFTLDGRFSVATANMMLDKLSLDLENNIPAWFSSVLLLTAAVGFGWMAWREGEAGGPDAWRYRLMTAVFVFMSLDESASLHEMAMVPTRERLGLGGLLYHAWVVPAAGVLVVLAVVCWPMLRRMSRPLRLGVIAAGAIFVGGAMGVEMVGGWLAESRGDREGWAYFVISGLEETMEMTGVAVLITSLAGEMRRSQPVKTAAARVEASPEAEPAGELIEDGVTLPAM
ncbi:MAG: hypothetical protein AAF800_07685 [Planctomycetota bacterium]